MSDFTTRLYNEKTWNDYTLEGARNHARQLILSWSKEAGGLSNPDKIARDLARVDTNNSIQDIAWWMYFATRKGLAMKARGQVNPPQFPTRPGV